MEHDTGGALEVGAGFESLPKLMARNASRFPEAPAYRVKEFGIWQSWTWADAYRDMRTLALGLTDLGLQQGEHVAVIGHNRPELYIAMVAVCAAGGVPVPLYQDGVAEEMAYVLDHCGARLVIAHDQEQVDKVMEIADRLPDLRDILFLDPRGLRKYDRAKLHDMADVRARGAEASAEDQHRLDALVSAQTLDDTCIMLYTSGTTGRPKGVVLSNRNIIVTAKNSAEFDDLRQTDSVLAYLPMAWVGDFIFSMGQALWTGFCVACPESPDTLQHDLREIGPTYFFAPPRFFE
ncbi:MAG: AMP-binding protein, partial [Pseudomonadota bacterium]